MSKTNIQLHTELENRVRFEMLISDISAHFVRLAADAVDSEIELALKQILVFFDVDRCGILEVHEDKQLMRVSHAYYGEGIDQVSKEINLAELFPWAYETLILKKEPLVLERIELPPKAEQDRLSWLAMGVKSSLTIPLFCSQGVRYVFTIQSLRKEHTWPSEFIPRLTLLGEIFVNVLERKNAEYALCESESCLKLAADSAGAGLWILDMATGVFWLTDITRALFGFPPEEEVTFEHFLDVVYPDDRERIHRTVAQALHNKEETSVEYRIILPDESIRWLVSRGRIHSGDSGKTNRLMGVSVNITQRKQAEKQLEERLRFEAFLTNLSAGFIGLPADQVDCRIEDAQRLLCEFLEIDVSVLWQMPLDQPTTLLLTHIYAPADFPPVSEITDAEKSFPWCLEKLLNGETICLSRLSDAPAESWRDMEAWQHFGLKSLLTIPLTAGGTIFGALNFNTIRNERDWSDEVVQRLQMVAQIFTNALARKRSEQMLRESEERLHLATDSAGVGLWIMDMRTLYVWVTPKLRKLFSFTSDEEVKYESFFKVIHPDDHEAVRCAVEQALQTKAELRVEYRVVSPDGNIRWLASYGRIYSKTSEETNRLMGVSIDITERMRAEEALRSSEARLEAGADLAGFGCYEVDFSEPSVFVDARFGDICGVPSGKQQGLQILEFWMERLHPDDRQHIFDLRRKLHEGQVERVDFEYRYLHPTAGQKWIHHVARVAKRDQAKNTVQSFGVIQDITERKRLSEQIQVAAEEWQSTFDSINDMIMVLDRDYRIVRVNKSTESFWGLPSEEIIGNPCYTLMHVDRMSSGNCPAANVWKTKQSEEAEVYLDQKNIWLFVTITPILDEKGVITGFMHSAKDITERKQAEEEIRRIREEYVHIARVSAMGELTASLAHELKQPLAAIRSNAQAALRFITGDKPNIDELHEVLKDIVTDNRRADDVIVKLRSLMRKSKLQITELDMKELVRDILPLVNSHQAMRKISLHLEINETIPAVVGDRIQMQQVMLNLILNSTEALMNMKKKYRSILVRAYQQDTRVVTMSVKDNGPGIAPEVLPHIFEPFYTTKQEGLGMGLAICRSIIEDHGGRLWAENNPDGGATFYFTVPIAGEN